MKLRILSAVTLMLMVAVVLLLCQDAVIERQEDLFVMRSVIDQYTMDKGQPPKSAADLVRSGYLKEIPKDIANDFERLLNE